MGMNTKKVIGWASTIITMISLNACSKNSSSTPATTTYFPKVKTIVSNNCLSCHSSSGAWSGRPTAFDSDSAIAVSATVIKTAVAGPWTFLVKQMPQESSLSASDITTIEAWVNKGGKITD